MVIVFVPLAHGSSFLELFREPRSVPPIAENQNPVCRKTEMLHSDVVHNASLSGNINAGNFTYLGDVHNMQECMGMCCASKKCQVAYLDKFKCYGVKCYSSDLCRITYGLPTNDVKISLMVKNDLNRKAYVTAYIVVVVVAFGAALSGTVWAVFIFVRKYRDTNEGYRGAKLDEEEGDITDETKVPLN